MLIEYTIKCTILRDLPTNGAFLTQRNLDEPLSRQINRLVQRAQCFRRFISQQFDLLVDFAPVCGINC